MNPKYTPIHLAPDIDILHFETPREDSSRISGYLYCD